MPEKTNGDQIFCPLFLPYRPHLPQFWQNLRQHIAPQGANGLAANPEALAMEAGAGPQEEG